MPSRDIIVVGASAGGVEALTRLVRDLPPNLPAAVLVALHLPPEGKSALASILGRAGSLRAVTAAGGKRPEQGTIYVAPADRHLLLVDGELHVTRGPRENRTRPAIDALFRTAARSHGPRVIGVILSGLLDDGTVGLALVKARGGIAVVQDPDDALFPSMPRNALDHVDVDHVLPADSMGAMLAKVAGTEVEESPMRNSPGEMRMRTDPAEDEAAGSADDMPGRPAAFGCPDCGGTLWEIDHAGILRFRCRTGHAYATESLLAAQSDSIEAALWSAIRALEETADLSDRVAGRLRDRAQTGSARRFDERAQGQRRQAALLRQVAIERSAPPSEERDGARGRELTRSTGT